MTAQHAQTPTTPADRARILLELLREQKAKSEMQPLLKQAKTQAKNSAHPEADTLRESARELLRRIGRAPKPVQKKGAMSPQVLKSTIAALLDGQDLVREHPAVIATVIADQSRATQKSFLQSLPGKQARRIQRALLSVV